MVAIGAATAPATWARRTSRTGQPSARRVTPSALTTLVADHATGDLDQAVRPECVEDGLGAAPLIALDEGDRRGTIEQRC